tara:strand:- start:307 stop:4377 length:4071 start_codon:yes stop_codon:yes gene_type:complete
MKTKVTILVLGLAFLFTATTFAQQRDDGNLLLTERYGSNYNEILDKYGDNPELLKLAEEEHAYRKTLPIGSGLGQFFAKMNGFNSEVSPYVARSEAEPNNFFNVADNIDDVLATPGVLNDKYTGKLISAEFSDDVDVDVYEFTVDTSMMYYFAGLHGITADGEEMAVGARIYHESDLDTTVVQDFKGIVGNEQSRGDITGRDSDGRGGAGLFRLTGWSAPVDAATGKQLTGKYYLWVFNENGDVGTYNITAYSIPFSNFKEKAEPNYPYNNLLLNAADPEFYLPTDGVLRSYMLYSDTVRTVTPAVPSQSNSVYDLMAEGDEDVDLFFINYKADHTLVVETVPYFGFYRENDGSIAAGSSRLSDTRIRVYNGDFSTKIAEDDDSGREAMDGPNNIHGRIVLNSDQLEEAGANTDGPLVLWVSAWASQELERTGGGDGTRGVDNSDPGRMVYNVYAYQYSNNPVEFEPNNTTETATMIAARNDTVINASLTGGDVDMFRMYLHEARMYSLFSKGQVSADVNVELFYESENPSFDGSTDLSNDIIAANSIPVKRSGKDFQINSFIPENTGAYIVKITSSGSGAYQLGVLDKGEIYGGRISNEPDNSLAEALENDAIQVGPGAASKTAMIFPANDVDQYHFTTGEEFTFTIKSTNEDLVKDFDTKLTLLDGSLTELATSVTGSITYSPSEVAQFILRVEAVNSGEVGFYSVNGGEPFVEEESNNEFATATNIVLDQLYEASLTPDDVDFFKVDLKAGTLYSFRSIDNNTGSALTVEFFDTIDGITLLDESGWADNYDGNFKIANIVPQTDKTYYIKISGNPGDYKILSRSNNQFAALIDKHEPDNSIAEASTQTAYLMDGTDKMYAQFAPDSARYYGDTDFFRLELKSGMNLVAEAKPVGGATASSADVNFWNKDNDTKIYLYAADGTEVASNDDGGNEWYSKIEFTATEDAVYYLQVANSRGIGSGDDRSQRRGDYILNVAASYEESESNNTFAEANTLGDGGFVSATFADETDIDIFKVSLEAGRIYHIRTSKEEGDDTVIGAEFYAADATSTNLYADGSGFNNRYDGDNIKINFLPETSGDFYLKLTAPAGSVERAYKVYMKSNDISDIKTASEPNNTIEEASALDLHPTNGEFFDYMLYNSEVEGFYDDLDYYKVEAVAGDTLIGETAPVNGEFWSRDFDAYMYLYDAEGNELASNDDGGYGWHSRIQFPVTTSGTYYFLVLGEDSHVAPRNSDSNRLRDPARGEYKFAITRTNGGIVTSNDEELTQAYSFKLEQNYPNPFNPTTNISYQVASTGNVQLEVFNLLGQKVHSLVNARQTAGAYTVQFDASNLATGMYFYRLQSAGQVQVGKMLLIK